MDAARWAAVRRHFEILLDLAREGRAAYLDALDDADLRPDLERMLARREDDEAPVDQPAARLIAGAIAKVDDDGDWERAQIGRRVGAFRLESKLGAGGMGTVYRAQRVDGRFEQVVAIKLVLAAHPGLRERFRNEQGILAGLNHPNIAQLVDGGETEDGIPYLAMEFVDGVPITEYCNAHLPGLADRLALSIKVAEALSQAHRNLVVHRDIKPNNILVTREEARPKLLDFGIAKLLGNHGGAQMTLQKLGPMTPAYAAPEQFTGGAISVATDVYQFGVLLFRLITGRLPYDADPDDSIAWGRAVLEHEPITLGRALRHRTGEGGVREGVRMRARDIHRDLDAILQCCLAKDPARRYGTMDALIGDLRAFLDGRPVQARHGGNLYRAARFAARHRWSVGLGTAALLGLVGLTVFSLVQWRSARHEAERALVSAQFTEELLKATDPFNARGGTRTALDLMNAASEVMQRKLAAHADLGNPAAVQIANAYINLGALSLAHPLYEKAIPEMRGQALPPLAYAAALERGAFAAQRNGALEQSRAWLAELEPLLAGESHDAVRIRDGMIGTLWLIARDGGKAEEALAVAERGVAAIAPHRAALPDIVQRATLRLGTSLTDVGRFAEGEVQLRSALDQSIALFGAAHGRSITARQTLGWHYSSAGHPERGLAELEPIATRMREVFGAQSQWYGANLHNRGNAYRQLGRDDQAMAAYRESAEAYRGSTSENSAQVGWALLNVGYILHGRGRLAEALEVYREVSDSWRTSMAADAPIRADLEFAMADAAHGMQDGETAAAHIERAMALLRARPQDGRLLASALALSGEIARVRGELPLPAGVAQDRHGVAGADTGFRPWRIETEPRSR